MKAILLNILESYFRKLIASYLVCYYAYLSSFTAFELGEMFPQMLFVLFLWSVVCVLLSLLIIHSVFLPFIISANHSGYVVLGNVSIIIQMMCRCGHCECKLFKFPGHWHC